jgi:hypothetical protein
LLCLLFDPEDGGSTSLRNFDWLLPHDSVTSQKIATLWILKPNIIVFIVSAVKPQANTVIFIVSAVKPQANAVIFIVSAVKPQAYTVIFIVSAVKPQAKAVIFIVSAVKTWSAP